MIPQPNETETPQGNTGVKFTKYPGLFRLDYSVTKYFPEPVNRQLGFDDFLVPLPSRSNSPNPESLECEMGVDALTLTSHNLIMFKTVVKDLTEKFYPLHDFVELGRGYNRYTHCLKNDAGVRIHYSQKGQINAEHFCVEFTGSSLKSLTQDQLFRLIRYFYNRAFKCTRIDPYLDLFELPDGFETSQDLLAEMKRLCKTKTEDDLKYVTGVKKYYDPTDNLIGNSVTNSLYLGSRKSEFMLRVYNKTVEQNLDKISELLNRPCIWLRLEAELKKNLAQKAFESLALGVDENNIETQIPALKKVVLGAINRVSFIDRKDKNNERNDVFPWWQQIVDSAEKLVYRTEKSAPKIAQKVAWLVKQVAPTLAALSLVYDEMFEPFINDLVSNGISRISTPLIEAINVHNLHQDWSW